MNYFLEKKELPSKILAKEKKSYILYILRFKIC